jgi:TolB-like protein
MRTADPELSAVREQLERVLSSAGFARNERLSRFLRFLVERHLEGRDDELKESVIALEVFDRGSDHDPRLDSIVRTEAGRLRARLSEYYSGEGSADSLIIELPKGGYIPVFRSLEKVPDEAVRPEVPVPSPVQTPPRSVKLWLIAGLVCGVVAVTFLGWRWFHLRENPPIPIAVLPLINLNNDPAEDYYADGLTGEIIRNLAIIEGLAVRSQTSSFALKGKVQKASEAAKQLGADYLVEGSALRSGQQLRINVQLIRVSDDFPVWSGQYERELTDVFAIQDEISRGVVNNLRLSLGRGRRRYETSVEAFDLYLRARASTYGSGRTRPADLAEYIPLFEQAIAKDRAFAPAYAGLAQSYVLMSGSNNFDNPDMLVKLRSAAETAVWLDSYSGESYDALGAAQARAGQWPQAQKSFLSALHIEPNRPESHDHFAMYYLLPLGLFDQAIREFRIAEKGDPLSTEIQFFLYDALLDAGRVDEAQAVCEKRLGSASPRLAGCQVEKLMQQGRFEEAIQVGKAGGAEIGRALARAGRRSEAEAFAASDPNPVAQARIFAALDEKDRVFESLDRLPMVGPVRMGTVLSRVARENPSLRSDLRMKAIRKKVGLPE